MADFRVGQRVRILQCHMRPDYIGKETVITRDLAWFRHTRTGEQYLCYCVAIDPKFGPRPDALAPIAPEGWQVIDWSQCLWQPEGVAA